VVYSLKAVEEIEFSLYASQPKIAEKLKVRAGAVALALSHIVFHCCARRGAGASRRLGVTRYVVDAAWPVRNAAPVMPTTWAKRTVAGTSLI